MRSTGKARDCLGFSLLLVEQVARGFLTNKKSLNARESNCGISFGTYWKCFVFNSHKFRQCNHNHLCGSLKPRHKHFSVRTCLVWNDVRLLRTSIQFHLFFFSSPPRLHFVSFLNLLLPSPRYTRDGQLNRSDFIFENCLVLLNGIS